MSHTSPPEGRRFRLGSRVGRRIFLTFLVCSLVPLLLSIWLAADVVERQLAHHAEERLRLLAKDLGMNVYERVTILADHLALISEGGSAGVPSVLRLAPQRAGAEPIGSRVTQASGFRSIFRSGEGGSVEPMAGEAPALGSAVPAWSLDAADPARPFHLVRGTTRTGEARLFLGYLRAPPGADPESSATVVWGEIDKSWLWWGAAGDRTVPEPLELVVLDSAGQVLDTTLPSLAQGPATWGNGQPFGSETIEVDGTDYLARSWRLSLHALAGSPRFQFVLLEPADAAAAPYAAFLRTVALSALLALSLIVLFSLVQIRRTLVPLERLGRAAQQLSAGHLRAAVDVESSDEFRDVALAFNAMSARLERQFGALRTRGEIDRAILSSLEPEQILGLALRGVGELVDAPVAAILLIDGSQERATAWVRNSRQDRLRRDEVPVSSLPAPSSPSLMAVTGELPSWARPLHEARPRSLLVAPLGRAPGGFLIAGSPREGAYTSESVNVLGGLAEQLSVALSNAALLEQLAVLHSSTLLVFARSVDLKSAWTSGHSERVAEWARELGITLGYDAPTLELLHRAGLVHDIGKIGVPDRILDKPGRLTPEETEIIRSHVRLGTELLSKIPGYEEVVTIVAHHHEWWNGQGYPDGVAGEHLHPLARLLSVADVFDALTSARPYRPGMQVETALRILRESSGTQFAPGLVEKFVEVVTRVQVEGSGQHEAVLAARVRS